LSAEKKNFWKRRDPLMKKGLLVTVGGILFIGAIMLTGCMGVEKTAGNQTPVIPVTGIASMTPPALEGTPHYRYFMSANGNTYPVHAGELVRIMLEENSSHGYTWTSRADQGIAVVADRFEPLYTGSTMPGAGGYHIWDIRGVMAGPQRFQAASTRAGVVSTGNDAAYILTLLVAGTDGPIYTESDNNDMVSMPVGAPFALILHENPPTGYVWITSMSSGLTVIADTFFPEQPGMRAGAGGMHEWDMKITGSGSQTIYGIYKRPGETTTGNEDTFFLTIAVR
jgi:predicted secreted protein